MCHEMMDWRNEYFESAVAYIDWEKESYVSNIDASRGRHFSTMICQEVYVNDRVGYGTRSKAEDYAYNPRKLGVIFARRNISRAKSRR